MTPEQEKIAESIIAEMKANNGIINSIEFKNINSIDETTMTLVLRGLYELNIMAVDYNDSNKIFLTEQYGWTFPGFDAQRHLTKSQKTLNDEKDRYDLLTKRFIYKARYVPFILSGLALAVSIFAYFKEPKKEQPKTQPDKQLTQPATNTKTSLPVDTGQTTMPE